MDWRSVEAGTRIVIQASKMRTRIMRYELTDHEWTAIRPMLPNKLAANYLAFVQLASIRLWLRVNESASLTTQEMLRAKSRSSRP
jgi:hypothetical protein